MNLAETPVREFNMVAWKYYKNNFTFLKKLSTAQKGWNVAKKMVLANNLSKVFKRNGWALLLHSG